MQTALLEELTKELNDRILAIDKAVINEARTVMLLLVENLPEQLELFNQYKQFIKNYKDLCQSQKLPTNF